MKRLVIRSSSWISAITILGILGWNAGCAKPSTRLIRTTYLKKHQRTHAIDPNDPQFFLHQTNATDTNALSLHAILQKQDSQGLQHLQPVCWSIQQPGITTIPFVQPPGKSPRVEAQFGTDQTDWIILDTGCPWPISMKTIDTAQHQLPVYNIAGTDPYGYRVGFCVVPELHLGSTAIHGLFGPCKEAQRAGILGQPSLRDDEDILLGLATLKTFRYIAFDNAQQQVTLSQKQTFVVPDNDTWQTFPLLIEEHKGQALVTRLSLDGKTCSFIFDTGSGPALLLKRHLWEHVGWDEFDAYLKPVTLWAPSYFGKKKCAYGRANIRFMDQRLTNILVVVVDNNIPLRGCDGLFGLKLFPQGTVVLDFEHQHLHIHCPTEPILLVQNPVSQ